MNNRDRILAVIRGEKPDKVPFCIFSDLMPRGSFERMLRNKGLGLLTNVGPLINEPASISETPNVSITSSKCQNGDKITYSTPAGDINYEVCRGSLRTSSLDWKIPQTPLIKDINDYGPLIFLIDDTVYNINPKEFKLIDEDLGDDGLLHLVAGIAPYIESQYMLGLENWTFQKHDHPEDFSRLLKALENRNQRYMEKLAGIEVFDLVYLGDMSDNLGPDEYLQYALPFFKKYSKLFRKKGKKCGIHVHARLLERQIEVLKAMAPDFLESYTPPPYSDLPLDKLRRVLGEKVIVLINCPETIFYNGYNRTKRYIKDLLKSDPGPMKLIGFTEMGMMGVNRKDIRDIFKEGFRAVYDAIEEMPY